MFKILLVLVGAAAGAVGSTSWLLSDPSRPGAPTFPTNPDSLQARWQDLKSRVGQSLADGEAAKEDTEQRLRRELDAYRKGARPTAF